MTRYALFDSAIGRAGIAWTERGVVRVALPEASPEATEDRLRRSSGGSPGTPPPAIAVAIEALQGHFAGARSDLTGIAVDLAGIEPFHAEIYAALRQVGWGETVTYGALAERVGAPGEAQAVGVAMARNRVPVIVPCHRVLGTAQRRGEVNAGGFSAYGGVATKAKLLALEGVDITPRQKSLF